MSEPRPVYTVTEWHGCYNDSWNGVITPDSFAHPAKFARGLIHRIYAHLLERGYIAAGDSVIDPFGGIAAGAYDALLFGLHWTGCELEPRFVEMGNANIAKYRHDLRMLNGRLGTARLLQGDSRRLVEVVGAGVTAVVSSPPYDNSYHGRDNMTFDEMKGKLRASGTQRMPGPAFMAPRDYGSTPGQLGSMPSGDYAAAVSSPPFGEGETRNRSEYQPGFVADMMSRAYTQDRQGNDPGNLAALRADDAGFSAAVSSPPYADAVNGQGEGPGARHDPVYHNGDNAYKQSSAAGYGQEPGNLGNMAGEGFEAAVSSPPYAANDKSDYLLSEDGKTRRRDVARGYKQGHGCFRGSETYGDSEGQLGREREETFWSAARVIVEQTYSVLRPGGVAVWVCKDFVRRGQRVPFSDQWEHLCAAVGFEPVERIHALLVEDHGEQLDIFGGATARRKERKSFFRRLAEKNGSPRIDHEDVIIMRRPLFRSAP